MRPLVALALLLLVARAAPAQDAGPVVRPVLDNVTRIESWSFFEPPAGGGDPDYTLFTNRAHLGIEVQARRLWFEGSFQYAQIVGLPRRAVGPGPLGPGASYFAAARTPEAYQLYLKSMSLGVKDLVVPGLSLQAGRMRYQSSDGTSFAGRLIGMAEWTPFERSFDGVRADLTRPTWRAHASFVMPTQGAFEESASPTIGRLQLASVSWRRAALEIFAHNYRDRRAVAVRPDNTGIASSNVDIHVQTAGAALDVAWVRAWAAVQRGRWYDVPHRAFSASLDAGHQWNGGWRPALRVGVLHASGDADPNDDRHGTFFPMVPTTTPATLRGTFAQMNLRDVQASLALHPHARLRLGLDVHHLSLARRLDGWYSGTGATAFAGDDFGFSSRRSTLRSDLGVLWQLSATATLRPSWRLSATTAVMRGGGVIRRQFAGPTLVVTSLESVLSLR